MVAKIEAGTKTIRPQGNRVLVKRETADDRTKGGIVLPDTAKEKPQTASVVAIGDGKRLDSGELVPISLEKGQHVILARYAGTEVKIDGEDHLIVDADEILAVLES